ncbi:inositol 1,4,5-trisphosphate receptor type 1-like isoform X3 [Physella acuta]|uniref:inositol 1,4,5-trisphosphate receptor type 1-like isoform X3 n=1 Tax=Physella acuta TaxID=109671 RepID=UPI0027DBF906|nr:inositol 1,4,5-trisphosphate receptor type 1-like isoform X3 [Physella acuta]
MSRSMRRQDSDMQLSGAASEEGMGEQLCIGDYLCLYCEETEGFVCSYQSSSTNSGLFVYTGQDRNRPTNIPNAHTVVFQVCIQNRYKLNKKYRKCVSYLQADSSDASARSMLTQAKLAAEAEKKDNLAEQTRQHGKRVRYGEIVQLKHIFTGKFVHMSTTHTSKKDKNNMKVSLIEFNAKNAQFRILPRYKVKSEGEVVQLYDQIVFESVKSPGHYFHASESFQIDHYTFGSELNLGVERSSFTLIGSFRDRPEQNRFVRGGCVIRLFHKELEAYLVAEGLFDESLIEDVHFRIRAIDQHRPKSLSPSTSGITYWQVEAEHSILDGDILRWEQQIRLRHMLTRQYLCLDTNMDVMLTPDSTDPRTVFRLHSVLKERDEIQLESYARIEHMLTSRWLHALKDEDYEKHQYNERDTERTMQGLRWDGAPLRKVAASPESMYDDAYTIQQVTEDEALNFNYVAGMVPFLFNIIQDQRSGTALTARKTHDMISTLHEIKEFIMPDGQPDKDRQKLLRNLRVIDLLVKLLQCPLREGDEQLHMIRIFKEAYDVLHAYMLGKSRKNALYIAKYIDFFQTQFTQKGGIGLNVAQMIVELIRDKRKIVDRITQNHIDTFIQLLRNNPSYHFLDLLHVLCVCDEVAIPNNQSYIVQQWLRNYKDSVYLIDRGQNINKRPNIVYISVNGGSSWVALHQFVDTESAEYDFEKNLFLMHQLDLMKAFCFGRNDFSIHTITREFGYITWEDAFLCIQSDLLPDSVRAKFTELVIGLFVDVGNNYSVLDNPNICFVYEYVGSKDADTDQSQYPPSSSSTENTREQANNRHVADSSFTLHLDNNPILSSSDDDTVMWNGIIDMPIEVVKDLVTIFPVLRDWLAEFLSQNCIMTSSMVGRNLLVKQVLRLLQYLVKFGYYMDVGDVHKLLPPLLSLLDGRQDVPFPRDKGKGYSKESQKVIQTYRTTGRFEISEEAEAVVNAKYEALVALDLLLTFQRNLRLKVFVTMFKQAEQGAAKKKVQSILEPLLYESYNAADQKKKALKKQRDVLKELREMFNNSAILDIDSTTAILIDLSQYKYEQMVVKSLDILNKLYSSQMDMFTLARRAQILLTHDSARVHREVQRSLPTLRRLARSKLNDQQVALICEVLDELCEFCYLPKTPEEPHPMNQNIMISHGILNIVLDILSQEIDSRLLKEQYSGMEKVFKKTLSLLTLLIRENHEVQDQIFRNLDKLLDVTIVRSELALALKEVFTDNQSICLKVQPRQIQRIVMLAAECQHSAPEFLDLLKTLVKVESLDLTIKRNQALVMKYIMQTFKKSAYVLDQSREQRDTVLTNQTDPGHLTYFISLVDLLATCAEGENKFIESLCQTILPSEDILWILNHTGVDNILKLPFIKFLMWVYMKASNGLLESGVSDLQHDKLLWDFLTFIVSDVNQLTEFFVQYSDKVSQLLKSSPPASVVAENHDTKSVMHNKLFFILDGVLPFLHMFYTVFYLPDKDIYPDEVSTTDNLSGSLIAFFNQLGSHLKSPTHLKNAVTALSTVLSVSTNSKTLLVGVLERLTADMKFSDMTTAVRRGNMEYYASELELNAKFHNFTHNCSQVHSGHNTVQAQLKIKSKREYIVAGSNEELPLGEEFQKLLRCFIDPHEKKPAKKFARASILLEQMAISAVQCKQPRPSQPTSEQLDVRCLQILRALIHNEERKLPEDWALRASESKIKKQINRIREVQCALNQHSVITKVLPHLARRSDSIAREVLAFICLMLFNANREVQRSMLDYFLSTREEVFFMAVRDRMQVSTNAIKEKTLILKKCRKNKTGRSLLAQHEARKKEALGNCNFTSTSMTLEKQALQQIQLFEQKMKTEKLAGWRMLARALETPEKQKKRFSRKKKSEKNSKEAAGGPSSSPRKKKDINGIPKDTEALIECGRSDIEMKEVLVNAEMAALESVKRKDLHHMSLSLTEALDDGVKDMLEYKDDGYIELVLKLLARICDGQHAGLQNYLREQPDNVKSFSIVAETAQFVNVVYTTINTTTIDLVIQLFHTLNEFCSGNQENRVVVYDMKVIDYINFILRAGEIGDCSIDKVVELQQTIGSLIISLTEENGPQASQVAKEVKDALDKDAVYRCMTSCYEWHQTEKRENSPTLGLGGSYLQSAKSIAAFGGSILQGVVKGKKKSALRESVIDVGFTYYLILARMFDIDPHLSDTLKCTPENVKAFEYYKKNCLSIEIVKEDILQKVNFRVKNKSVLRDEVKEKLKWNVDRTSPSNKIRDLMGWTRDIMRDITYQRKILDHPISKFFTKGWLLWNYGAIVLSLTINIIMLVTWDAKSIMEDCSYKNESAKEFCPGVFDPMPKLDKLSDNEYQITIWALGGVHILCSLFVLISYFLSYHPKFPRPVEIKNWFLHLCGKSKSDNDADETKEAEPPSKLNTRFFSFTTFYYLIFLGMSVAGILFHGYFFAFHLLNIVNNNQLLGGVIKAVTQNGMSLLWVAVLGLIVIYIYTLIGFALLRVYFKNESIMYCSTLWQCTVTVVRYGLIGDMFEELKDNQSDKTFASFWPMVIYHVSFFIFITTIGLNIIFGIIVDTFSELRDLKWRAESDMKDTCFICSRNSYDFEHHGKGFDHHVNLEHNMWGYVYFILHLDDIKASDYTALELYVAKLMEKENYEYMPLNRALCLTSVDIDSTESKIDDLLTHVTNIAKKQKEEEAEKKRKVEKLKQRRWQEKHRALVPGTDNGIYQDNDPMPYSRAPSVARSTMMSASRAQSQEDLDFTKTDDRLGSHFPAFLQAPIQKSASPKEDGRHLTLPSSQARRTSLVSPQRDEDSDLASDSDSDSGSYQRQGSYDLMDDDLPSSLPLYPSLPAQAPPSDQFTAFPPPPSLPTSPQVIFHPASAPTSPREEIQLHPTTDREDDTRPNEKDEVARL